MTQPPTTPAPMVVSEDVKDLAMIIAGAWVSGATPNSCLITTERHIQQFKDAATEKLTKDSTYFRFRCFDLEQANEKLTKENEELRYWKESMIKATPDWQEIGRVIGVRLGDSVSDKIIPTFQTLTTRVRELEGEVEKLKGK